MRHAIWLVVGLLLLATSACTQAPRDETRQEVRQEEHSSTDMPEVISLTEKDVTGFISAASELKALGVETEMAQSDLRNIAAGLQKNPEAMRILEKSGFDAQHFVQVTYSIGLALGALDMKGKEGQIARTRAKQEQMLESLKSKMPAEQYEIMRKEMEVDEATLEQYQDQPEQNLQLVEKYRAQIESASKEG